MKEKTLARGRRHLLTKIVGLQQVPDVSLAFLPHLLTQPMYSAIKEQINW